MNIDNLDRRQYLALTGLIATGTLAGCSSEGDDDGSGNGDGESDDGSDNETSDDSSNSSSNQDSDDESTDQDQDSNNDSGDQDDDPEPASFDLTVSPLPAVGVGEDVSIDVAIENTGGQEATQTVTVTLDGDTVATDSVTLASGERTSIGPTFTAPDDPDDYDVTVTTDDDTVSVTLTVEPEPASFEIVNVDHPNEVDVGEEHTFSITVENVGGQTADFEGMLEISTAEADRWEDVGTIRIPDVSPGETETWESDPTSFDQAASLQLRIGDFEWSYDVVRSVPDLAPQTFTGSGQEVRQDVTIDGGLTVVEATHDGSSNFQVSLEGGDFPVNFVNVIGRFDGAQADLVDEGEYILDVNADGNWEITIRQPRATTGESLPVDYSGSGPDVIGPVEFGGTGVASGEHDGSSNFQVQIVPMEGTFPEIVFNEIGSFEGETAYTFDGIGWVDVNADGNWSIQLE